MALAKKAYSKRGMAMVLTLIMVTVVLGAVMLVSSQALNAKRQTEAANVQYRLEEACKAGIDHTVQRLWNQYLAGNGNVAGTWLTYRAFITNIVTRNATATLINSSSPLVLDSTRGISVTEVTVSRVDDINGFLLTINATAKVGTQSRTAQQTVRVGGSPFTGFDYAVLANNINCILCHAEFRSVSLDNNTTKSRYGTFDRVKVSSMQNLMYRSTGSDPADSRVAGTVYTRGNVINSYTNTALTNALVTSSTLTTYQFDANGYIKQNATSGAMTTGTLSVVTGTDSSGAPLPGGNMYMNYPTDKKKMKDGLLPSVFPAPYPDDNNDKVVQSDEFHAISELLTGTATGGIAYGVPAGSTYTGTSFPTESTPKVAEALASDGKYVGNLILTGTTSNPIQLSGQIAVEGDLMLRGVVKGSGQVFVKGNLYIAGDVTYADGTTFGTAADGTKNALAVITGGNVMVGDFTTIRGKNHSKNRETTPTHNPSGTTQTPAFASGVTSWLSIQTRVRNETITNVPNPSKTSDAKETLQVGYFDPDVTDGNGIVAARKGNQQASFTQAELMIFNNLEMAKAVADTNYKPRFYGLNSNSPDNIYFYDNPSSEHAIRYDEGATTAGGTSSTVLSLAAYITKKGYASKNIATRAARLYLNPSGGWLSDSVLRQMWWDDEQSRTTANSIYKFDGLLYCNNAIFAITRSKVRHGSNTEGKMRIRGSLICPDIGILTAGNAGLISGGNNSLLLQYDDRVKDFWAPQDRSVVTFQRQVYDLLAQAN